MVTPEKKQNSYEKADSQIYLATNLFKDSCEDEDDMEPVMTETASDTGGKWTVFDVQANKAVHKEDRTRGFPELCSTEISSTQNRKLNYKKSYATFPKVEEVQSLDKGEGSREYGGLEKGANHKRVLTEVDFDVLKEHQLPCLNCNDNPELSRDNQALVEEYLETVCEQSRSLLPQVHHAQLAVGHEVVTMPGKSPGRKRKQPPNGAEPTIVNDPADPPISPQTIEDLDREIADSQEAFESEGNVVNSKRVKKDKLKQNAKETDAVKSANDDSTYAHKNARDSGDSYEKKDAQKKRSSWSALDRYKNIQANSLPDYGSEQPPSAAARPAPRSTMGGGAVGIGSFKPRNTLNNDRHNASSPTFKPYRPAFDLQNNVYHPNKKQKIDGGSVVGSDSHIAVIELEADSSHKRITPSIRSANSYTQNGHSKSSASRGAKPVPEFRDVEDNLKPKQTRRRNLSLSHGQGSRAGGPHHEHGSEAPQRSVFKLPEFSEGEDPNDRIVDVDMISPKALEDTHPEVIIRSYNGAGSPQSARQNLSGSASKISKTTPKETGQNSPYFNGFKADRKRRGSSPSKAIEELSYSKLGLVTTNQQNGVSFKRKRGLEVSTGRRGSELDLDELALVTPESPNSKTAGHLGIANQLLGKRRQPNGSSAAPNMNCQHDLDSEDSEAERKKADIDTTSLSKKPKWQKVQGEDRFNVIQVFSQSYQWLIDGRAKPWSLRRKDTDGSLSVYDHEDAIISDLVLMPDSIRQVLYNGDRDDGKLQLQKSKDQTAKGASQVFLELGDSDQSYVFCEKVRLTSTITLLPKAGQHLHKLFMRAKETSETAMKQRKLKVSQERGDIQFLPEESRARVAEQFDKAEAAKKSIRSQGMKNRMTGGEDSQSARISSSPLRQTRSSELVGTDSESSSRRFKVPEMGANTFYGRSTEGSNPHATRSRNPGRELAPRPQPKLRSPSPERWTETHPDWEEKWRNSIIYPREGKNKATVDKQDIERLDEGQFLNDNLIMFYLLWLERELAVNSPELSNRIYFHNTFFYERLSKSVKGKKGINYEAVERWTSRVDLMSYDYIVVPVNEHTHWYVAIICNAPKLDPKHEVVVHSQSQELSSNIRSQSDAHIPARASPPGPHSTSPSELAVRENMKQMPLKDGPQDAEDDSWPNGGLKPFVSSQRPPQQGTPPRVRSNDHAIAEPSKPELSSVASEEQSSKAAAPIKRGKRKSLTPAPRKYDPKEPRIITLDSLALSHSLTCTNLRDYLIAEYKSKRKVEIFPPRALGMTATVPGQKNHCDCGLFLLSYIEQFLKCPDEFTEDLLQRVDIDVTYDLRKAPEMRNHIRHLLFDLQEQQKKEDTKKSKGKGKKILKDHGEDKTSTPAESVSREVSKSNATSAEPERPPSKRSSAQRELSENGGVETPLKQPPQHNRPTRESTTSHPAKPDICERNTKNHTLGREIDAELAIVPKAPSQEPIDLDEEAQAGPEMRTLSENIGGIVSSISSLFTPFSRFHDDAGRSGLPQPGASRTSPLEIEDESPQKSNYHAQQPRGFDSPSRQLQEDLKSPSPEATTPQRSLRDRSQTPYVLLEPLHMSSELDEVQDRNRSPQLSEREENPVMDSSPLQPAAKLPSPKQRSNSVDMASNENDVEMLLGSGRAPSLAILNSPSAPPTPTTSPKNSRPAISPQKGSSRRPPPPKCSQSSQPFDDRRLSTGLMEGRDPLDKAMIAGRWKVTPSGKHTHF